MRLKIDPATERVVVLTLAIIATLATAAAAIQPPPEPSIQPIIPTVLPEDLDGDGIEDQLLARARDAEARLAEATTEEAQAAVRARLDATVSVELVFSRQITQPEIDAFLAAGGEITYLYRAVSYGWNGTLRLGNVEGIAADLGGSLVILQEAKPTELHLDEATQTGRVRPIWAAGFAGVGAGIDGDSNTTIAIIDTGVDTSHTDLIGREEGWIDQTPDIEPTALDYVQHGTHVAAIATGTGTAHGSAAATLSWTDSGRLTAAVPNGSFIPSPVHIVGPTTLTSTATFTGSGSTDLFGGLSPDTGSWGTLSASTFGNSPLGPEINAFLGAAGTRYGQILLQNAGNTVDYYAVANTLTSYPAVGDGFNTLSGVCPACRWYGEKVFTNTGSGLSTYTGAALDDIVVNRVASNIKVANMSLGTVGDPGLDTTNRAKANTAVINGIFVAVSAGNDGAGTGGANVTDDPGRASLVMTVGSTNDSNQLTEYTSSGFTSPGVDEDYKPDVLAPGGSLGEYSRILAADSNTSDGASSAAGISDLQANDYNNLHGTSMASPFVAGAAGLVIDAMQQAGTVWSFASSTHPLFVKMILCATATETNMTREDFAGFDPELNRNAGGTGDSAGWPARKDRFEGYGVINPDAAVEAVLLSYTGDPVSDNFPGTATGRRSWARNVPLLTGQVVSLDLQLPTTGDFDMYLFSGTPDSKGNPVLLGSSTSAGNGDGPGGAIDENISFFPKTTETGFLVIKRVSGSGTFHLSSTMPTEKDCSRVVAGFSIPPDKTLTQAVSCPSGTAFGGGFSFASNALLVHASRPTTSLDGWTGVVENTDSLNAHDFDVVAVCCDTTAVCTRLDVGFSIAAGETQTESTACPLEKPFVYSGGFSFASNALLIHASRPTTSLDGWTGVVENTDSLNAHDFDVVAVCCNTSPQCTDVAAGFSIPPGATKTGIVPCPSGISVGGGFSRDSSTLFVHANRPTSLLHGWTGVAENTDTVNPHDLDVIVVCCGVAIPVELQSFSVE